MGIGNADFSAMETLDADSVPLESDGVRAQRDIVQFVPFSKFSSAGGDPHSHKLLLAKEVLAEIPKQLISYMRSRGFSPQPPRLNPVDLPPNPELM